jgi:FkbH-like protein
MKSSAETVSAALRASSRTAVKELLCDNLTLSLTDVLKLTRHLRGLGGEGKPLRLAILRTYSCELLAPHFEFHSLLAGLDMELHLAPFGVLYEEQGAGLEQFRPDVVLLFLRWEDLDPRLGLAPTRTPEPDFDGLKAAAVTKLEAIAIGLRRSVKGLIVLTLLPPLMQPGLGQHDAMSPGSEGSLRAGIKRALAARLRENLPSVLFDDLDELVAEVGRNAMFDRRLWYSSRSPFSVAGAQALARRLITYPVLLKTPRVKVIALDADNTLWGGVVGEEGLTGIALGPDFPGSAFVAFQKRLLDYQARGVLLALCTKNNPADVLEVLRKHPHQQLREQHFAGLRMNWASKIENLKALAAELNLGLDAFLFVDDSPHECALVKQQLPEVRVQQTPAAPEEIPACLERIPALEVISLTREDLERTAMYVQNRQRQESGGRSGDLGQYLQSLQMVMTVCWDEPSHMGRIAQLTQKTNQFNLTTRRYSDAEIQLMMGDADWLVADFALKDVFGESGIVGVALVKGLHSSLSEIDTFLMSCRVIGREAESAFLKAVLDELARRGAHRVRAEYLATSKNVLVQNFWPDHGFQALDGTHYELDLSNPVASSHCHIQVEIAGSPSRERPPGAASRPPAPGSPAEPGSVFTSMP